MDFHFLTPVIDVAIPEEGRFEIITENLLDTYQQKLGFYSCTVPVFEQLVLSEFIEEGHMERYINRRKRKLRQNAKKPQ